MPAIGGSVGCDRVATRMTPVCAGGWCNRQHARFWSANPGFESLLPNSVPGPAGGRALVEVLRLGVVGLAVVVARVERALVLVGPLGVDERRGLLPLGRAVDEHRLGLL